MTKHLRLIMLSLLAMICLGGYSQSDELAVTLDFTNSSNPWNFPKSYKNDGKAYNYTYNGYTITMQAPEGQSCIMFTSDSKHYFLQCYSNGINLTLPRFDFDVTKIVLELYNPKNVTNNIYVNDKNVSTAVNANSQNPVTCTFDIVQDYQKAGHVYTIKNTGTSRIQKIMIYKSTDSRKDAGISFANNTYTVDFAKGKFEGAKLNNPNKLQVSYTILPEKEGTSIDNNGVVTFAKGVEATYTVTAKFAGNGTYKPATATYTLNVVDPNFETRTIEFVAGVNKSNNTQDVYDELNNDIITISSDRAAFGWPKEYRFYNAYDSKKGETTISTKYGTITKIEFAHAAEKPLENLSTQVGEYKYDKTTKDAVWTGNSKSVLFTAKAQARVSRITVTVKVPVAKDYTLDENSVNTIEAYENANVTLKRTFYKDGEWNTLCLPFAVADAKTAFDNAELREVDTKNSHDNTIVFKEATAIEAGKPYLIKWAKTPNEVCDFVNTFEGVTLVATATPVKVNDAITFTGFYNKTTADKLGESVAAIGAENKLFKVTSGEMKGFRAAFVLNSNAQPSAIKLVIDGTATGIEDLVIDGVKANGRVYNLNGQYVGNSLNGLQPGLYIQNGKKIVVK